MFELTNKQRECFAQPLVSDTWVKRELTPSRYHDFKTFAYVEGNRVRKMITVSDREYREFGKDEMLLIAKWMKLVATDFEANKAQIKAEVEALCARFPIYE